MITKGFQISSLNTFVKKCEQDLDNNYEGIVNELEIEEFNQIVRSYREKLGFYVEKVQQEDKIDFRKVESIEDILKKGVSLSFITLKNRQNNN